MMFLCGPNCAALCLWWDFVFGGECSMHDVKCTNHCLREEHYYFDMLGDQEQTFSNDFFSILGNETIVI